VAAGLDILPTLADYAGAAPLKHLLGTSLRPIAEGKAVADWRSYVVSENGWRRMLRSVRFKYCVYDTGTNRESLVDLETDPGGMKNLASLPEYRNVLLEHRRSLSAWIAESNDTAAKSFCFVGSAASDR